MNDKIDDIAAFEQLFNDRYLSVKQFVTNLINSEEDANDITQDVFIAIWSTPRIWKDNLHPEGYIYNMAKYRAIDFVRHRNTEQEYLKRILKEWMEKDLMEPENDAIALLYYKDICDLLKLLIADFPEQRKRIFLLSRFKHLSNQEIADKLGITIRTVEHQIYLALTELKKIP